MPQIIYVGNERERTGDCEKTVGRRMTMEKPYLTPKEAAAALGMSVATITRCVQRGAPVHRWGSTGRRYRIEVEEFQRWMERQGQKEQRRGQDMDDVDELARRRRQSVLAVGT